MAHPTKMSASDTGLLVIDVQEKLMDKIPVANALIRNIAFLIDGAKIAGLQVLATEQYPKGLGTTVAPLAERVPERPDKVAFSCWAVPEVVKEFSHVYRPNVVLVGIESHVCVMQTALDLLDNGNRVFIPVDAVGSRYSVDHETALRRLENLGAILTTSEMCVFEWVGGADHPEFKKISRLVQDRMQALEDSTV